MYLCGKNTTRDTAYPHDNMTALIFSNSPDCVRTWPDYSSNKLYKHDLWTPLRITPGQTVAYISKQHTAFYTGLKTDCV